MSDGMSQWLDQIGLGQYKSVFVENDIDEDVLPELSEADLEKLGLSLGHRKRLMRAVADMAKRPEVTLSSSIDAAASLGRSQSDLAVWERTPGERKPVTLLFADITGSTALTETLDPEEAHKLLYGATKLICQAVEKNSGTVCKIMGDGVMAVFGAPLASEYHALEACSAALDVQGALTNYAADTDAEQEVKIQARVGLHSGEVVVLKVGEGDNAEYDASGPVVSIAARMEQSAKPGEIYLTGATKSLAYERVETDKLEPVQVKGISEPIRVYSLRRIKSVEESKTQKSLTTFVGRHAELNQFRGMVESCIEYEHGQALLVRGEPGIGKTRLVEEFAKTASEFGMSYHRGLVLPFGVGKGQDAIRSLVRSFIGLDHDSDQSARSRGADKTTVDKWLDPDQLVFLNDLLDLPQPTELRTLYDAMDNSTRNRGKQAVVSRLLTAASAKHPIIVIVEDVHWADAVTLSHLASLTKTVADCSALLVMTSRIDGDPLDQMWLSTTEGSPFTTIQLGPLRKQDAIALIEEFITPNNLLAKDCLERASGNPLFLEQLLRSAQEGSTESLPDSIRSLVLARMDRLTPEDKQALQAASVIGQRFNKSVLEHLLGVEGYDAQTLAAHNLVREQGSAYLFAHALVQEAVYGSLLKDKRRKLHRKAAGWFANTDLVLHAEHLGHAGDEAAPKAFLEAARDQAKQYRIDRALELVIRGLEITPVSGSFELKCFQGEMLRSMGSTTESIQTYKRAGEIAVDGEERCRAQIGVAEGLRVSGAVDKMLEELDMAEALVGEDTSSAALIRINQLRGNAHFFSGNMKAGLEISTKSLEQARAAGSEALEAQALSNLGDAEFVRGRMLTAHDNFQQSIALCRKGGFGQSLAANMGMLGITLIFKNEFQASENVIRASIDLARRVGQLRAEMMSLGYLGYYMPEWLEGGELTEAKEMVIQEQELARRLGAQWFEANSYLHLARLSTREGECTEAERCANEAIAQYQKIGSATVLPMVFGALAEATNDPTQRHSALEEGESLVPGAMGDSILHFYRDAIEACLNAGEWESVDRYANALEEYTRAEPLPWSDFHISRGRTLAAVGRDQCTDATIRELRLLRDEAKRVRLSAALPSLEKALSQA